MKIINGNELPEDRIVKCPKGGFISHRMLLESDRMGFTVTKTIIPAGDPQRWHYKNHLESCYCVSGEGLLLNCETLDEHKITPGILYALDKHDEHIFQAITDCELICVFNPPLKGKEIHNKEGVYE